MSITLVQLDEVRELMDQMMDVQILPVSEKHRMLMDDTKPILDPNLIMEARHNISREPLPLSPAKCSILSEARRLLTDEDISELNWKNEQEFLERELRKFEKELKKTRPKFGKAYNCSRKSFATSDDDEFWRTFSRVRVKSGSTKTPILISDGKSNEKTNYTVSKSSGKFIEEWSAPLDIIKENEEPCISNIKVTIKDKPHQSTEEERLETLRMSFDILMQNVKEERRLRNIERRIQGLLELRRLRRFFDTWRRFVEHLRKNKLEQVAKSSTETNVIKIEMLVDAISEKQKELVNVQRPAKGESSEVCTPTDVQVKNRRKVYGKHITFDPSPAQCRLNAQKAIIEKQKMKLAEQDKLIEEMRLKQVQDEIAKANSDTVNVAKETLTNCGQKTRRTLIQLMRQAGYRGKALEVTQQKLPEPPKFLVRMEARAVARRERVKIAEMQRRGKLEEQKKQQEEARQKEKQEKKRAQQEALRKIKKLREEQERHRACETEKFEKLNEMADNFYRKYLLRRYILEPFYSLLEIHDSRIETANAHYRMTLMRRIFIAWNDEVERHRRIKIELAVSTYNRNIAWYILRDWRNITKQTRQKCQVAKDLYDLRLLEKTFKVWRAVYLTSKAEQKENEQLAVEHYIKNLRIKYLKRWKRYSQIAGEIDEIENRKNKWRQIVQQIIPDFDPKYRGVALED